MAKIVSIIQYVGKAGNTVGQKSRKGGIILKQKAAAVSNPKTPAQMAHRARFKLATVIASMLGEVGRVSLQANGFRKTDRGELVKRLLRFVFTNQNQAQLKYALHLINNPTYNGNINLAITSSSTAYTATFTGASSGEIIAKAILVFDQNTGIWRHATALDTLDSISIGKETDEAGHAIEVYAYGIVLEPKTELADTNLSEVDGNGVGYIVNVEGISSEYYNFSPTISAMLAIASDGTQSGGSGGNTGSGSGGNSTQGNYTLTLTATPATSGTLTATVNGVTVNSGSLVASGSEVRLTATPAPQTTSRPEVSIVMNSGNGNITVLNNRFIMPAANTAVVASFSDSTPDISIDPELPDFQQA